MKYKPEGYFSRPRPVFNNFADKTLEELEVIRKAKSNTAERYLNDITMIDKELEERRLKRNVTSVFRAITGKK